MKKIEKNELKNITGGGFNIGIGLGIATLITLLAGIVDGIVRPLSCN
jgi:lactobin A/cerein 7B family class IIb bacteriocin